MYTGDSKTESVTDHPATNSLGNIWKHICPRKVLEVTAHCGFFNFSALYKYSYLLTYECFQGTGARLKRCDHITEALISLHWLRVPEQTIFKVATLTYRALHGSAPPYLASSFTCVADMPHRRRLRSASTEQLDVHRSTIGGRAFPVAGAKVWNDLPSDVTSASSLPVFKNRLKTYLFRRCYETVWLMTFPLLVIISPQNSGPCNSFYCLGHSKMSMMMMMMMMMIET